jgi:hypothetical protein
MKPGHDQTLDEGCDPLRPLIDAALSEFGEELRDEARKLHAAAFRYEDPCASFKP